MGRGVKKHEMAILYRSNAQSRVIEQALVASGIPYRVYGGLRFFDRAEIKHALAYLRLIENPKDDTAFLRVVNFPMRGIGAKSMETLQQKALAANVSLYEAAQALEGAAGTKLRAFTEMIDAMRFEYSCLPLPEMIAAVVERSGLSEHYKKEREPSSTARHRRPFEPGCPLLQAPHAIKSLQERSSHLLPHRLPPHRFGHQC